MAATSDKDYGIDLKGIQDVDEFWSEISGLALVVQDAIHTITCEDFLGPGGDNRGFDVTKLVGAPESELRRAELVVPEILTQNDDRIKTADLSFTSENVNGLLRVSMSLHLNTEFGPFEMTRDVSTLTAATLEELGL